MNKKDYQRPAMRVIGLRQRAKLLIGSTTETTSGGTLGRSWTNSSSDAWDGSSSSGGSSMGGWTDSGGSAWE